MAQFLNNYAKKTLKDSVLCKRNNYIQLLWLANYIQYQGTVTQNWVKDGTHPPTIICFFSIQPYSVCLKL